ncbi:hypothetical protein EDB89DRAFT_1904239 [Lactarius sanguifluus]|nr:hypothetical protein EDB89DRAFT_1904239 [Lactarius sanguifluus]
MPLLSSDMSDYDFSQFGHWDGDSASYYEEYDHYTPPGPSRQSSQPCHLPLPLTPLASPSAFVQEFEQGLSTSGTQYEYTLADIHSEPLPGLPSPISCPTTPRPATPLEYREEAFPPEFDIQTQVVVHSAPLCEPTPELVYPDSPVPSPRPVSTLPRVPSPPPLASTPPHIPTPDSPIDYEHVAEQSPIDSTTTDLPSEWENILPASFFQPPSLGDLPRLLSESTFPVSPSRLPLLGTPPVFPSVTPFCIQPPHLYTLHPRLIDPAAHSDFPPLYICSKAILDVPSVNLPLGSVRYNFREGLWAAFFPLSNILQAGYIDSLVTLEVQDFFDRHVVTTYGHLHFTFNGQCNSGIKFLLPCPLNRVIQTNTTMPPTFPRAFTLTEEQHMARARAQFNTHRDQQVRRYYPDTSIYDLSQSTRVDCWADPPLVLKNLVNLFEFGETWDHNTFNDFQDDLSAIVDACNNQLLFWHLSDITIEQLVLWTKSDYFWFNHIPPRRNYLIQQRPPFLGYY